MDREVPFSSYSKIVEILNIVKNLHIGEKEEGKPLLNNGFRKKANQTKYYLLYKYIDVNYITSGFYLTVTIGDG